MLTIGSALWQRRRRHPARRLRPGSANVISKKPRLAQLRRHESFGQRQPAGYDLERQRDRRPRGGEYDLPPRLRSRHSRQGLPATARGGGERDMKEGSEEFEKCRIAASSLAGLERHTARHFYPLAVYPPILVGKKGGIIGPRSSGTPGRPSAVIAETCLLISGLSRTIPPLKSVCTAPGATTLAVIRRGPNSLPR